MAASYLGGVTVGGAGPGFTATIEVLGDALTSVEATISTNGALIASAVADIRAVIAAVAAARVAIRIPAVVDFEANLDAALSTQAAFTAQISDPTVYVNALLSGVAEATANLGALVPSVAIDGQLAAIGGLIADLTAKIGAVDLELDALVNVELLLGVVADALVAIEVALNGAIAIAGPALAALAAIDVHLGHAGAHAFVYTGTLGGLGAAVDLVTPSTGLGAGVSVKAVSVLVETSDATAVAALDATFKVS